MLELMILLAFWSLVFYILLYKIMNEMHLKVEREFCKDKNVLAFVIFPKLEPMKKNLKMKEAKGHIHHNHILDEHE